MSILGLSTRRNGPRITPRIKNVEMPFSYPSVAPVSSESRLPQFALFSRFRASRLNGWLSWTVTFVAERLSVPEPDDLNSGTWSWSSHRRLRPNPGGGIDP